MVFFWLDELNVECVNPLDWLSRVVGGCTMHDDSGVSQSFMLFPLFGELAMFSDKLVCRMRYSRGRGYSQSKQPQLLYSDFYSIRDCAIHCASEK